MRSIYFFIYVNLPSADDAGMGSHRSHVLLTSQKFLWSLHQPTSFSQSPSFQNLCSFSFNFQRFWTADWLALTSFWRSSIVLCLLLFNIFTGLFWACIVIKVGRWRGRKERDGSRRFNCSAEMGEEAAFWEMGWEERLKIHSFETKLWNTNREIELEMGLEDKFCRVKNTRWLSLQHLNLFRVLTF